MATRNANTKTVTCANANEAEVWTNANSGYNLAQDGDTIIIPAATNVAWDGNPTGTSLVCNKAVTFQGAGIDQTIIQNNLSGAPLIVFNNVAGGFTRVTGFTFKNGTSTGAGALPTGVFQVNGSNTNGFQFRFDHNKCDGLKLFPLYCDTVIGVVDHNTFINCMGIGYTCGATWDGGTYGHGSWTAPTAWGTNNCIVYEDNYCHSLAVGSNATTCWDGTRGGRVVARHNTIVMDDAGFGAAAMTCHGNESQQRSIRLGEFYCNNVLELNNVRLCNNRGGIFIAFNNRVQAGTATVPVFSTQCDREADPTYYGRASGSNKWDKNGVNGTVANNSAWSGCAGYVAHTYANTNGDPKPYELFVALAGTTDDSIVMPGTAYPNYVGYCVTDEAPGMFIDAEDAAGKSYGEPQYEGSVIIDQTTSGGNTVLTTRAGQYTTMHPHLFKPGHPIRINRVLQAMDMIGRALGSLITTSPATRPAGWNDQVTECSYEWNNFRGSTDIDWQYVGYALLGTHFKNDTVAPGYPSRAGSSVVCGAQNVNDGAGNPAATVVLAVSQIEGAQYPHPLAT